MKPQLKRALLIIIGLVLFAGAGRWYIGRSTESISYRTAEVKRGDLTVSITATGTLQPEEVVDVGAQVAGLIFAFGQDKDGKVIDYGSEVEEGTVLAKIDDSLYAADVALQEAQKMRAYADKTQMQSKYTQAESDWKRAQNLISTQAIAKTSWDAYRAAFESAKANLTLADAGIAQAEASLQKAKRNLGYCTIASPVKGVIIDRRVNIGQTVVSSLNAPSLFLIAKDLRLMQVWAAVNEADIGRVFIGQQVTFTVDAFPGETFSGTVRKIRLNASMTQNVVTYTVEIDTENSNLRLLPYLTANVRFVVSDSKNVLLVPNAALRWTPPSTAKIRPSQPQDEKLGAKKSSDQGTLWLQTRGGIEARLVSVFGSDGKMTQIQGDIQEGSSVIIGVEHRDSPTSSGTNPFAPQPFRKSR